MRSLLLLSTFLVACVWATTPVFGQEEPDINAFVFVEKEPEPTNLGDIRTAIVYPEEAVSAGVSGTVVARILVGTEGQYLKHEIVKEIHPALAAAVEAELPNLTFSPAMQEEQAVMYWKNIPFPFRLVDEREETLKANIEELTDQLTGDPDNYELWHKRGVQRSELGQYEDALIDFDEALKLNPRKNKKKLAKNTYDYLFYSHYARAAVLSKLEKYEESVQEYNLALEFANTTKAPDSSVQSSVPTLHLERGYTYALNDSNVQAESDFRWIIANSTDTTTLCTTYPLLLDVLLEEEQANHAKLPEVYTGLISCTPDNELLYYSRGYYQAQNEDFEDAVKDFAVVVERSVNGPIKIAAFNQAGMAYFEMGNHEQALAEIQNALDVNALNPVSYYYRGLVEDALGKESEACESFRRSLSFGLDGEDAEKAKNLYNERCGTWEE
ncbi:MAG: tetratricopeptide repeat protein [Bacteroidota bacterium]